MKHEFKVKKLQDETVYTLESATGGGTSAGAVSSVSNPVGGVQRRASLVTSEEKKDAPKPRNFVAKNAKTGGAGAHKDKKKAEKQGDVKHKNKDMDMAEGLPQTLRKVVPGYAKREIDKKMDAGKFGKTDADKDANFQRYKKIQDKIKEQGKEKHKKPYMESLKGRIEELKSKLDEVSLGDYSKKAKMDQALSSMSKAFGNDQSPEQQAKLQHKIDRREIGLGRAKARTDKQRAEWEAKRKAEHEAEIRAKYANVDIDAEIAKLQPAIKSAYHDYQYGARNTYSQAHDEYNRLRGKVQELERAKEILAQGDQGVGEDAPFLAKAAGGLALGALGAAGAPAIVGLLGPILGTALAAYGAYNSAKGGMWAVDKLWDMAAKKLGGDNSAAEFAKAHMRAAAKGEGSFEFNGSTFKTELKPTEVPAAAKAVKQVSESKKRAVELSASLNEFYETSVMEKIPANAPVDVWIKDFEKSTAPQFRGKNKEKRRQMAIAASYGAKNPKKKKK